MTTMLIAMRGIIAWCITVSLARIEVVYDAIGSKLEADRVSVEASVTSKIPHRRFASELDSTEKKAWKQLLYLHWQP
jgi:hypothetical protein